MSDGARQDAGRDGVWPDTVWPDDIRWDDDALWSEPEAAGAAPAGFDCQTCGACCSFSRDWPRFTLEDDAALALIPEKFVDDSQSRMRCDGERCSALAGEIGKNTACSIYAVRPDVCRACQPGDDACRMARRQHGMDA